MNPSNASPMQSRFIRLSLALLPPLILAACAQLPSAPAGSETATPPHQPSDAQPIARSKSPTSAPVIPNGPLQSLTTAAAPPVPTATVATLEAPKDLWDRVRRGFAMPDLDTDLVRHHEQWYASRPDYIQRMVDRGSKYLFHIVEEVERRGLPQELALLPFIESAFNPQAVSHAKAAGMWQFMPATGRDFDLKQNAFRDDRRDVLASTRAALDYLERLHRMFGDWHLALAAYNWGNGNVSRAIQRNRAAGLGTGYLDLRMPDETRNYVPKLQAVKNLIADPQRLSVRLPHVGNHPFFDTVTIDRDMDVALIAELAGVSVNDFHQLNPAHNKPVIMAAGTPTVLLPWDNAALFEERLRQHQGPTATWTAWRVPRNMTIAEAARQHQLTEAQLREINRIPPRMMLRAGSTVLVPRQGKLDADVPEHIADNGQILLLPEAAATRAQRVTVRAGDTLSAIARRHGVTVANLQAWNHLRPNQPIRVGQVLVVHSRTAANTAPARASAPARQTSSKTAASPGRQSPTRTAQASSKTPVTNR
ncbi:membrane-bound lytic murein transglycosylase D [Tepidicella xavieri]|uniref:Membrane-bound lytic murein transglycosylase D n=2 Tax=Tepidicella xavieri TaxID=360241 RepID=A0A4R6UFT9_9BURK|nr:membrane-bound lytic murein transglycosylase D [Tepidicella xavieri]